VLLVVDVDNIQEQEKLDARKILENGGETPPTSARRRYRKTELC